jgi:protein tyrosine phosphatase (PTP) superfamily phosphohydrolase (DUF442 family)
MQPMTMITSRTARRRVIAALAISGLALSGVRLVSAQSAVTIPVPGIDTFRPVTTTIACGTNPRAEAMAGLRAAGFASVVTFSEPGEPGYDHAALEQAATAAGLRLVSLPFNRERPDPAVARRFLEVIAAPETSPAYLSCSTGQRATTMWLIKRVVQDGWTPERAMAEAEALGLTRPELKRFATEFLAAQPR